MNYLKSTKTEELEQLTENSLSNIKNFFLKTYQNIKKMESTKKTFLAGLGMGVIIGASFGITATIGVVSSYLKGRIIPKTEIVQEGCIAPNRLEIECKKPLDEYGRPPTLMRIDGLPYPYYILKEIDNKPMLLPYPD